MEEYLNKRPKKTVFEKEEIEILRNKAIKKIKFDFLPNEKVIKIVLIGSSIKNTFGKYEPPGFRGSLFSDFDFIIFVEDSYEIPEWLNKQSDAKPFSDDSLNLSYRNKNYIDNKYDVEIFFVKEQTMLNLEIQKIGELAGIPMTDNSQHSSILVYKKNYFIYA